MLQKGFFDFFLINFSVSIKFFFEKQTTIIIKKIGRCFLLVKLKCLSLLGFFSSFLSPLLADEFSIENHKNERGMRMKGLADINITKPRKKEEIFEKILKVLEESRDIQKEILKVVQNIESPKPKEIVVNGKKCIANSSKECFQMPLTPNAQKIPVYKNWLRKPNEKNTIALTQWQAEYNRRISKSAHLRDFVITKYADKAYPAPMNRFGFDSTMGYHQIVQEENNKLIANSLKSKYELYLYFGKNPQLDYQSFGVYSGLLSEIKDVTYHLVFYTQGSKEALKDSAQTFLELQYLFKNAKSITVNKRRFAKEHVYTTPTLSLRIKGTRKFEPVAVGKISSTSAIRRVIKMLEVKDILKPNHSPDYKMFERVGKLGERHVSQYYHKELNMTAIKKLYKKDK